MFGCVVNGKEQTETIPSKFSQTFFVQSGVDNLHCFGEIDEAPTAKLRTSQDKHCDEHTVN